MAEDWGSKAIYLGYETEYDMLYDMYVVQEMSAKEIGLRVTMAQPTVMRRLRLAKIDRRTRGGPQASQRQWTRLHMLDQRVVFYLSLNTIAKRMQVSISCVYKFKRMIRGTLDGVLPDTTDEVSKALPQQT